MQIWIRELRFRGRVAFQVMGLDSVSMVEADKRAGVWAPPSLRDRMTRKQAPVWWGEWGASRAVGPRKEGQKGET